MRKNNKFIVFIALFVGLSWTAFAGGVVSGGIIKKDNFFRSFLPFSEKSNDEMDFKWVFTIDNQEGPSDKEKLTWPFQGEDLEFVGNHFENPISFIGLTKEQREILDSLDFQLKGWEVSESGDLVIKSKAFALTKTKWLGISSMGSNNHMSNLVLQGEDLDFVARYFDNPKGFPNLTEDQKSLIDSVFYFLENN